MRHEYIINDLETTYKVIDEVRSSTSGMLNTPVYVRYFEYAKNLNSGNIVDVGTGQGGSTISLALGLKNNPNFSLNRYVYAIDQFYQNSPDGPHPFSWFEYAEDCINKNIEAFRDNLKKFNIDDIVKVISGELKGFPAELDKNLEIELLVIDTDGYLDRDFGIFFDNVMPGGIIIIDDYANRVNSAGRKNLRQVEKMEKDEIEKYIKSKKDDKLKGGARILGKHLLTCRFAYQFLSRGMIEILEINDNTLFTRKITNESYRDCIDDDLIEQVRKRIENDFVALALKGSASISSIDSKSEVTSKKNSKKRNIKKWLKKFAERLKKTVFKKYKKV